jgi:hypothetical protein
MRLFLVENKKWAAKLTTTHLNQKQKTKFWAECP